MKRTPLQETRDTLEKMLVNARTIEWFDRYINAARDQDSISLLINLCKDNDATLVCRNQDQIDQIQESHKIHCIHVNTPFVGRQAPLSVVSNIAIAQLMREAQQISRVADQLIGVMKSKNIY